MIKINQSDALFLAIPEHVRRGLILYFEDRIEPGNFLYAVLENNLKEAIAAADSINRSGDNLFAIVSWLYNEVPSGSWGSPRQVQDWLNNR